jgi:hypothetical protein
LASDALLRGVSRTSSLAAVEGPDAGMALRKLNLCIPSTHGSYGDKYFVAMRMLAWLSCDRSASFTIRTTIGVAGARRETRGGRDDDGVPNSRAITTRSIHEACSVQCLSLRSKYHFQIIGRRGMHWRLQPSCVCRSIRSRSNIRTNTSLHNGSRKTKPYKYQNSIHNFSTPLT